jgi:hypothetical protein
MAFHFFADIDHLATQGENNAFGLVAEQNAQTKTIYRLTSEHGFITNGPDWFNIYAICNGTIFVVPKSNPYQQDTAHYNLPDNRVTVILLPSEQPKNGLPPIKYIIYRGIHRASLLDINGKVIKDPNPLCNNLTTRINNAGTSDEGVLGINWATLQQVTFNWDMPIDNVFYLENGAYQLFSVEGGFKIGSVKSGYNSGVEGIGIDIVFDSTEYNPTFKIVKPGTDYEYENFISKDLLVNLGSLPPALKIETMNIRETAKHFLDPCAFFGSFSGHGGLLARRSADGTVTKDYGSYSLVLPQFQKFNLNDPDPNLDLYQQILSKFYNKNKIYVDIRNPQNLSLNYYENYQNNVLFQLNETTSSATIASDPNYINLFPKDYYAERKIPILTFNQDNLISRTGEDWIFFTLALPDDPKAPFDNTPASTCCVKPGIHVDFRINVVCGDLVSSTEVPVKAGDRWVEEYPRRLHTDSGANYGGGIKFKIPTAGKDTRKPVSQYIRICYLRDPHFPELDNNCQQLVNPPGLPNPLGRGMKTLEHLDNVFTPFSMFIPRNLWGNSNPTGLRMNVYYEPQYLDNSMISGTYYMAFKGIAKDQNLNVTLFAFRTDDGYITRKTVDSSFAFVTKSTGNAYTGTFLQYLAKRNAFLQFISLNLIFDSGSVPVESLSKIPLLKSFKNRGGPNLDNLVWVTISANEFNILKSINESSNTNPFTRSDGQIIKANFIDPAKTYLGMEFVKAGSDNNGVPYVKYAIKLRGESVLGSGTKTNPLRSEIVTIDTNIFYYSVRTTSPISGTTNPVIVNVPNSVLDPVTRPIYEGTGYTMIDNGANRKTICCRVYLSRPVNVSLVEFCEYLKFFERNIRQIWNNDNSKNIINGASFINQGILPDTIINADCVFVLPAPPRTLSRLRQNEILFILQRPTIGIGPAPRSFVLNFIATQKGRIGVMNYTRNPDPSYNRYSEVGPGLQAENIPAHEFGHTLGLIDRYCPFTTVDPNVANAVVNVQRIHIPIYIQTTDNYDPEYTTQYNWANNLYSTQRMVPVNWNSALMPQNETTYQATKAGNKPQGSTFPVDNPPYYQKVTTYITQRQILIAANIQNEDSIIGTFPFAANAILNNQTLFFLPTMGAPQSVLSFIGLQFNNIGNFVGTRSDFNYAAGNALNDPDMIARSNNAIPIVGYFSPFFPAAGSLFSPEDFATGDPAGLALLDDIVNGGLSTLQALIQTNMGGTLVQTRNNLMSDPDFTGRFAFQSATSYVIDISTNDIYRAIGTADANGRAIWNRNFGTLTITYPSSYNGGLITIRYGSFNNRQRIITHVAN